MCDLKNAKYALAEAVLEQDKKDGKMVPLAFFFFEKPTKANQGTLCFI